jgi:glycosyltransferase involved in cell wall biosynthesis
MHRAPAGAPHRLRQNRTRYDAAVRVVRRRAEAGDLEGVLRSATVAANFAWRAPIGMLNDPELERLVVGAAGGGTRLDPDRSTGRVLHVLSEAYEIGGHSRLVWRWIARDPRRSDVALTNQDSPVPEPLRAAVTASGGRLLDLRSAVPTLTGRAQALRALMDSADIVVHHVHPYDAVALAAAALPGERPPVVVENHADFNFWLGLGCADVVSDFLDRGRQWSQHLRGIASERLGLLPLPVDEVPARATAAAVRRTLRLGPDDVVALSVSILAKTAPVWGRGFAALLERVLETHPRLKVVLAGPPPVGSWGPLVQRFPGRLVMPGPVSDPYSLYAAADIYLESYPVPSGTSVLEAAMAGLPVLTLQDLTARHGHARLFHADSPGLAGVRHAVATEHDYLSHLRKLIRDPALRAERGAAAREAVRAAHSGPGWSAALEALYDRARSVDVADLDEYPEPIEDLDYAAMMLPFASSVDSTPELLAATGPLGPLRDDRLVCDLFVASNAADGDSLSVRVAAGWEGDPEWTRRLLALAARYPTLSVSLPFAAGDDDEGSLSVAHLTRLLALDGRTTSDCGDLSLDARTPSFPGPSVSGELPLTQESLDRVEALVASPLWASADAAEPVPV